MSETTVVHTRQSRLKAHVEQGLALKSSKVYNRTFRTKHSHGFQNPFIFSLENGIFVALMGVDYGPWRRVNVLFSMKVLTARDIWAIGRDLQYVA